MASNAADRIPKSLAQQGSRGVFRLASVLAAALFFCALGRSALAADGTPWLSEPGSGYVGVSYVMQSADKFYRASTKVPTPGGGEDLQQGTIWLNANYALADAWALDVQLGWAKSDFIMGPGIPTTDDSFDGLVDTNIGLTWRLVDELESYNLPSVAIRAAAIISGDYETGHINSLGDGGDGFELSLIVGKFLSERVGVSAEFGYRNRNEGIPENYFTNLSGIFLVNDKLGFGLDYRRVDSQSGLDIGGPGFSPDRFPELQEENQLLGGRVFFNANENLSLALFYAAVVDGRNTEAGSVFGGALSYTFQGY